MHRPRLAIAGTHSGSGKTTVSLALMTLLARQGQAVSPFKIGPDYIDSALHQTATGRVSRNLDAWLLPDAALRALFLRHAAVDSIAVIEGVMGLFDGLGASAHCSTAHVAALFEAPVILVVNAEGSALSAAALVSGFASFRPSFNPPCIPKDAPGNATPANPKAGPNLPGPHLAGVILNRVSGPAHYALLRGAIEEHTGLPCFGWLDKNKGHENLDIPGLIAAAHSAPPLCVAFSPLPGLGAEPQIASPIRLGIARDAAFSLYYQDNLDMLEELGAKLIPCSPLKDAALPDDLDGLYLGSGFPEIFAQELEDNLPFRQSLKTALEHGLPAFAECGGLLYLCAGLHVTLPGPPGPSSEGTAPTGGPRRRFAMTGFFPQETEMTGRLQPFGYVNATLLKDCILGRKGDVFRGHEFHYSRLIDDPAPGTQADSPEYPSRESFGPAVRLDKADGRSWSGGLCKNRVLAMHTRVHFHGCPDAARHFIQVCRKRQKERR